MFTGSEFVPTAERACLPFSPNTSTSRSEAPLMTCGCSWKGYAQGTRPISVTIRRTLSRSPTRALSEPSNPIATSLAA